MPCQPQPWRLASVHTSPGTVGLRTGVMAERPFSNDSSLDHMSILSRMAADTTMAQTKVFKYLCMLQMQSSNIISEAPSQITNEMTMTMTIYLRYHKHVKYLTKEAPALLRFGPDPRNRFFGCQQEIRSNLEIEL